ncbi:15-hydroxyprostaglandin dehydrogenase [NAD(+)]-like [Anoplophora glabripennis]|uniref:15-hydroxyprostaglandin dehydrogenase [NAD(+)]-like n=1 Tax=Anoplophora glabripennis TaxID=217634 RepID=UPI000873EBF7|nr:15-hydroxyprostaglandin dehydrogenase [NAD(+)]-like [Anoplophora glabripennis]
MSFFDHKVALVTGGASGIGLSIIQKLLQNGIKGVTGVDISDEDLEKAEKVCNTNYPNKTLFMKVDVTKPQHLEDAFEKTIHKFKNLDVVVNNAGIIDEVQWEKTLAVNLEAVIRGCYLAKDKYFPSYKSGDEGIIINVSSVTGFKVVENMPVYCATKHGVIGLGKALGAQNSKTKVITICPGLVSTSLHQKIVALKPTIPNWADSVRSLKPTSPEFLAESVIKLMREGKHGSIWMIENENLPYEVNY